MMYPLILCSILAIGIILERAYTFRKATAIDPEELLEEIKETYKPGDHGAAAQTADGRRQDALLAHLRAGTEERGPPPGGH